MVSISPIKTNVWFFFFYFLHNNFFKKRRVFDNCLWFPDNRPNLYGHSVCDWPPSHSNNDIMLAADLGGSLLSSGAAQSGADGDGAEKESKTNERDGVTRWSETKKKRHFHLDPNQRTSNERKCEAKVRKRGKSAFTKSKWNITVLKSTFHPSPLCLPYPCQLCFPCVFCLYTNRLINVSLKYLRVVSVPFRGSLLSSPITLYTFTMYSVIGVRFCSTMVFTSPSSNTYQNRAKKQ